MFVTYLDTTSNPYKPGASGLSDMVWEMAGTAAKLGINATIIGAYAVDVVPPVGVRLIRTSPVPVWGINVVGQFLTTLKLWREVRRQNLNGLFHSPEPVTSGILSPWVKERMICTVSGNIHDRIQNGNPFGPITTQSFKLYTHSTAKHASAVVAISEAMKKWWEKSGTSCERLFQIPLGVDIERFKPMQVDSESLGLNPDKFNVLFIGRISYEKGIWDLLEAMTLMKGTNVSLHLVGGGPLMPRIKKYIELHHLESSVQVHGPIPRHKVPLYYSAADLTVLPSYTEGMPRTMVEAMACGSPFLGTRISGIEDHIHEGNTGFIVEPHQPDAIAEAIIRLSKDDSHLADVAQRAQKYVREKLTWTAVMQRVKNEVYDSLATTF